MAALALRFGPAEYFGLGILALATVASVLGPSIVAGVPAYWWA
jgi:TctA family transporter